MGSTQLKAYMEKQLLCIGAQKKRTITMIFRAAINATIPPTMYLSFLVSCGSVIPIVVLHPGHRWVNFLKPFRRKASIPTQIE